MILCTILVHELSDGAVTVSMSSEKEKDTAGERKVATVIDRIMHHAYKEILKGAESGAMAEGKDSLDKIITGVITSMHLDQTSFEREE